MAYSGHEKAAIFLTAIGEDVAVEIFKNLDIRDISKITSHMTRIGTIKKADMEHVFSEFSFKLAKGDMHVGGGDYVKKILSKGLGEDNATRILEMASMDNTIDSLKWVDSETLSNFLVTEHPQTIALVLCLLEPSHAAEVLAKLPDSLKADISMRIAATERIPANAIEELEDVLRGHLDINKNRGKKLGGIKTVAEILNQCDRSTEGMILDNIEIQNNLLADSIRQFMFVFDDLENVDDRGIQMLLKEISSEDLSVALKSATDNLKDKIFKNMSQRAAQILKEDMELKGPVKVSDVEKAQQSIVKVARKLEEEGKIVLGGRGGDNFVV